MTQNLLYKKYNEMAVKYNTNSNTLLDLRLILYYLQCIFEKSPSLYKGSETHQTNTKSKILQ